MSLTGTQPDTEPAAGEPAPVLDPHEPQRASDLDPRLLVDDKGVRGYGVAFARRLRGGELGSLPVLVGLVVIWFVFWQQQHAFLSSFNLSNLAQQMSTIGFISIGVVMVLLLGEVDLSAGSVSGLSSAILATQIVHSGRAQGLALLLALLAGAAVGAVQGFFFTRFGVPSFVVTLAGLLAWQGLQQKVLGVTGTVTLPAGLIHGLTSNYFPAATGWSMVVVIGVVYLGLQLLQSRRRAAAGLRPRPLLEIVVRTVVIAGLIAVAVAVLNNYRGVPECLVIFIAVIVVFDIVIRKTTYGRHVLAVGGNAEAARRAGIRVSAIRLSVFSIAGMMAAAGGIMDASLQNSANLQSGGSNTLLYAIAAAVIGGTSLFGGRGSAYSALLGILVIESIANGMALLSLPSSDQYMITGGVLLAAVTLDALSRRGQRATGRV